MHTGVADWPRYTQRADVLIAAAGVPASSSRSTSSRARSWSAAASATRAAGSCRTSTRAAPSRRAITPRVGGVGPTTVAMLFRNAVAAAERATA
ncbi:hypothetical protein [Catenuloplanes niger]